MFIHRWVKGCASVPRDFPGISAGFPVVPSEGAGVVQSGLYFAATALHLVVALLMLLVTGGMWVNEGESP
jgi:hypothetical protein